MQGGKRQGAGRPKGSKNKRTGQQTKAVEQTGKTPLEYLLSVMRDDEQDQHARIDAAKAAAPYVHAKLNAVHSTEGEKTSFEDWLEAIEAEDTEE